MKLTILGCGTSGGVPRLPEYWGKCDPSEPRNRRRRSSILIEEAGTTLLVDTTPDLRQQMLDAGVHKLDAVFYTHDHADHTHGIDDLRGFFQATREKVPVYGDAFTLEVLKARFDYIFRQKGDYPAIAKAHVMNGPVKVGPITMIPFEQGHGDGISYGFRFGDMAYSTDLNVMPESAFEALEGVKVWVVDALRPEPHPTHTHLAQTLEWIERVKPARAILTHMTWDMDYQTLKASLPAGIEPAYDGMVIEL
ncbi:MBL fold metallo-hydrolase [Gimibacter soli]|uniref:MBL fold metallo-hydrolase n=1 Tax=Gimibacter soli TaxID=3024400 RepID=A0AAF0BL03_9PROT|nr:MBL fold metallo-hydrolase [Gimibacter soli]WCL52875.1 MBL fold metallo-hydrolase [Gimibacter soli]